MGFLDSTTQKKKKRPAPAATSSGLVPPPPPVTPLLAQVPQLAQSLVTPQPFSPSPVAATPTAPASPQMLSLDQLMPYLQPNPADVQALQGTRDQLAAQAKAATDNVANLDSQFLPMPSRVANTQFEDFLQKTTQAQIMKELSGGNSAMDRFDKGQQIGQRIAASLVIPLMGALGKAPGTAAGANAAVQDINNQLSNQKAIDAQERAHRNNAVMNLSQLYEKLSPDSAANVTKLLSQQIETRKYNDALRKEAMANQEKALTNLASVQKDLMNSSNSAGQHLVNAALGLQGQGIQLAGQQQSERHFQQSEKDKDRNYQLQQQSADLQQSNFQQRQAELQYKKDHDLTEDGRKAAAQQLTASTALEHSIRLNMQDALGTKADGSPKYAGYADYLKQNPAVGHITERLAAQAGIPKSEVSNMFDNIVKSGAPTPGGGNWWDSVINGARSATTSILGTGDGAPVAAPAKAPEAPSQLEAVMKARGFKKVDGKWVKP